jgi:ATP-dependent DNA helicase RecG
MMDSGHDLTDVEIMENRRLGRLSGDEFVPNNACALLFSKDTRRCFPGCKIRVIRYDGNEEGTGSKYNAVKEIWIEGTIPQLVEGADSAIRSQLRTFAPLGKDGRFEDAEEYPYEAWHEAIVNACVHRSYGNGLRNVPIFVRLFDNRLEIESPGPFPPFVTADNIYKMHSPRHPYLMEALFFAQLVRMNREGTRRMLETMQERGLPAPEFAQKEIGHALVRVTLRNDIEHRRIWIDKDVSKIVSEAIAAGMSQDQKRIVNWLAASDDGTITINGVVKLLGIAWQTAQQILFELCRLRVVQYIRFKPLRKDDRDQKAFFRLRSKDPLPPGAHEETVPPA